MDQSEVWVETKAGQRVYYYNKTTKETSWIKPENAKIVKYDDLVKPKPVSTVPIPGTTWCVVTTDKSKVFYFNQSTKISVWEKPSELANRDDVNEMVSEQTNDSSSQPPPQPDQPKPEPVVQPELKPKPEPKIAPPPPKVIKKESPSEIEKDAAKKRETIPFEERVQTFRQLLKEKEVDPSSTFQRELSKIVFDPRYLLLMSNERKEAFEKYCLEMMEEERKKKRERMKKASEEFKALLSEANLTSRSIYDEFHSQYSSDPRFKALERSKDREILFDDHLASLRRKERHEGSRISRREPEPDRDERLDCREYQRRRDKYQELLSETKEITLGMEWRDARRIIRDDPRYIKFSSSERRCEREFRDYMRKRKAIAEENFKELLRETKLIDQDTRRKIEESEHQHLIDILCTLQNDDRYVELDPYTDDRRRILLSYIERLASARSPAQPKTPNNSTPPPSTSLSTPTEDN